MNPYQTAILFPISSNVELSKFCFSRLLQLYPAGNISLLTHAHTDEGHKLAFDLSERYAAKIIPTCNSLGELLNTCIDIVDSKYFCFYPPNTRASENSIHGLIYKLENIVDAGVVGIKSNENVCVLTSMLNSDDKFELVHCETNGFVSGMWLAKTELLKSIRFETDTLLQPHVVDIVSKTANLKGLCNFYIVGEHRINFPIVDSLLFPQPTQTSEKAFKKKINEIFKLYTNERKSESYA
jgi:hypothetical protein